MFERYDEEDERRHNGQRRCQQSMDATTFAGLVAQRTEQPSRPPHGVHVVYAQLEAVGQGVGENQLGTDVDGGHIKRRKETGQQRQNHLLLSALPDIPQIQHYLSNKKFHFHLSYYQLQAGSFPFARYYDINFF